MANFVDVVDEFDNVIGAVSEEESTHNTNIITRAVAVFVFNSAGELYLQKRAGNKVRYPLFWDCSVSGFIDTGEAYYDATVREMYEELGIELRGESLTYLFKKLIRTDKTEYTSLYRYTYDGRIDINKNEIESGGFFASDKIKDMIKNGDRITPFFIELFRAADIPSF